nr:chemosensory protein 5 [Pachyrhinus yasumatsui]
MKVVFTAVLCCCGFAFGIEEKYTTKFDNVNFEEIIHSERLLKNYVNCLLDKGSCTPDGKELKKLLPDALETNCQKCSDVQKEGLAKIIKHMVKNKKDWWNELEEKYDSQRVYVRRYKEEWKKQGFTFEE